jgi:nucleoside 2-deoxyribosyltransferase
MNIYFAGSIRGGRQDAKLYREIIELLKEYGDVLTEHVGETGPGGPEDELSDEAIHKRDMAWLEQADVLVAEVTVPSHGVGYEIGRAELLAKPTLCLYRPGRGQPLSALIAGNPLLQCAIYQRVQQLEVVLASFLQGQGGHAGRGQVEQEC